MGSACTSAVRVIHPEEYCSNHTWQRSERNSPPIIPHRPPLVDEVVYTVRHYSVSPKISGTRPNGTSSQTFRDVADYTIQNSGHVLPALRNAVDYFD